MNNTLYTNDVIMVNKLKYGPKLPRSPFEIPWVNIAFYFNDNAKERIKENWWDYKRLSGTTTIKQGDVFVFSSTWNKNFTLVKRCVALPGDTLEIKNAEIHTNSTRFIDPNTVKNNYIFVKKSKNKLYKIIDSLGLNHVALKKIKDKYYQINLSKFELNLLKKSNYIDSIIKQIDTFNSTKKLFGKSLNKWTIDNITPVVVPKKRMHIKLNKENFSIYEKTINRSENCSITEIDGAYFLDNKRAYSYMFKQDYYFVMGDNRKWADDSRVWGFIPESNIIGKVQCVLWSNYQGEFQWNRLFKSVN